MVVICGFFHNDQLPFFRIATRKEFRLMWCPRIKQISRKKRVRKVLRQMPFFALRTLDLMSFLSITSTSTKKPKVKNTLKLKHKAIQTSPSHPAPSNTKVSSSLSKEKPTCSAIVKRRELPIVEVKPNELHYARNCWMWNSQPALLQACNLLLQKAVNLPMQITVQCSDKFSALVNVQSCGPQIMITTTSKQTKLCREKSCDLPDESKHVSIAWYSSGSISRRIFDALKSTKKNETSTKAKSHFKPNTVRSSSANPVATKTDEKKNSKNCAFDEMGIEVVSRTMKKEKTSTELIETKPFLKPKPDQSSKRAHRFGGDGVTCCKCHKTAYPQERIPCELGIFHTTCFRCCRCKHLLQRGLFNIKLDELYCNACFKATGSATTL
jgi:hypothetical protein